MTRIIYAGITISFLLFLVPTLSFGAGKQPCGFSLLFDNHEFTSNDQIPIRIKSYCNQWQGSTATVIVSDGNSNEIEGKILERRVIVNDTAEIIFETPNVDDLYRYLVTVMDSNGNTHKQAFFFTKEGASEVTFSDISIPREVNTGEKVEVEVKVVDGIGNPIPTTVIVLRIQYPECYGTESYQDTLNWELEKSTSSTWVGEIDIPNDMRSGIYDVEILAESRFIGYEETSTTKQIIVDNKGPISITQLFHNVEFAKSSPFFGGSKGTYVLGDRIIIRGETLSDRCINPISNVEVLGELEGLPTPLSRDRAVSDENGQFKLSFQTYPQMNMEQSYRIELKAKNSNKTYEWHTSDIRFQDIKRFNFEVENKTSTAEILVNYGFQVVSFTLDEYTKTLTFVGDATNNEGVFYIAIPHELLDGSIMIKKDGKEVVKMFEEIFFVDERHSEHGVGVKKQEGYTVIEYHPRESGKTTLEITGTTMIPEFPIVLLSLTSLMGLVVIRKYLARWFN